MSKLCNQCWNTNENALLKLCKQCYYEDKIKNPTKWYKAIKKISNKKIQRLKEWWSETSVFEKVNEIDVNCWICNKHITEASSYTFPHLLAKSKFPALRLFPNNIWRACDITHHTELDTKILKIRADKERLNKLTTLIMNWLRSEVRDYIIN